MALTLSSCTVSNLRELRDAIDELCSVAGEDYGTDAAIVHLAPAHVLNVALIERKLTDGSSVLDAHIESTDRRP